MNPSVDEWLAETVRIVLRSARGAESDRLRALARAVDLAAVVCEETSADRWVARQSLRVAADAVGLDPQVAGVATFALR